MIVIKKNAKNQSATAARDMELKREIFSRRTPVKVSEKAYSLEIFISLKESFSNYCYIKCHRISISFLNYYIEKNNWY